MVNEHSFIIFKKLRSAQQGKCTQLVQAITCSPKHSVRSTIGWTTPAQAAPRVPFLQRRITNPPSDQNSISQQPIAPGAILRCHPLARMQPTAQVPSASGAMRISSMQNQTSTTGAHNQGSAGYHPRIAAPHAYLLPEYKKITQ